MANPEFPDLARPGARIVVRVTPRASRDAITREGDILLVRVTATPEDGKANKAVTALLAKALGVPKSALVLERGATARLKTFLIAG